MKTIKCSFLVLAMLLSFQITRAEKRDTTGVFMTLENEMVYMVGEASITASSVQYKDTENKNRSHAMRKMKWMVYGNRVWCGFPITKGGKMYRLQEIIAMNKNYVLMTFWQ